MNSKNKINIIGYLKSNNVKRFSLFIIIAFVFLIFSKLSDDYKQSITLNLKLTNVEDEIIIKSDTLNTLNVYIEAKGFALVPFIFNDNKAIVLNAKTDLISKPGRFIFDTQKHKFLIDNQLGKSLKLVSVKPDSVRLMYSKRASKKVPIVLKKDINFDFGYDYKGDFILSTDSVKIVGPEETINPVIYLETTTLKLNEVNTDINELIAINSAENLAIDVYPKLIHVKAEVKRFTEGKIELPITLINKPENSELNFFPKSVIALYYVDLENYKTIKASDFLIECDYLDLKDNQTFLVPKVVKKPPFVKRITLKQNRIDFIKL